MNMNKKEHKVWCKALNAKKEDEIPTDLIMMYKNSVNFSWCLADLIDRYDEDVSLELKKGTDINALPYKMTDEKDCYVSIAGKIGEPPKQVVINTEEKIKELCEHFDIPFEDFDKGPVSLNIWNDQVIQISRVSESVATLLKECTEE